MVWWCVGGWFFGDFRVSPNFLVVLNIKFFSFTENIHQYHHSHNYLIHEIHLSKVVEKTYQWMEGQSTKKSPSVAFYTFTLKCMVLKIQCING